MKNILKFLFPPLRLHQNITLFSFIKLSIKKLAMNNFKIYFKSLIFFFSYLLSKESVKCCAFFLSFLKDLSYLEFTFS